MTPGIQVVVARKGKVIYQKSFGNHTHESNQKVSNTDVYDCILDQNYCYITKRNERI